MEDMEVRESVTLPVDVESAWAVLSDTPRMVELDPFLIAFQPENGVIEEGTLNEVTSKLGPLRMQVTSRTALLEPPRRAVFESVRPSRPVRVRTEDRLVPVAGGCRYEVRSTITPVGLLGRLVAPVMARIVSQTRRQFMSRLVDELSTWPR